MGPPLPRAADNLNRGQGRHASAVVTVTQAIEGHLVPQPGPSAAGPAGEFAQKFWEILDLGWIMVIFWDVFHGTLDS